MRISHLMGICATEYGLSGEFPSGRSRFFLCGAASCHREKTAGFFRSCVGEVAEGHLLVFVQRWFSLPWA
ncbi:hypothetical protein AXH09_10765 [Pseudomonas aeruginosa]|uniref:hypothetical protein n=1 Tax=Pseudomonas aeruginosa TaxID=287 RepID=UPI0007AA24E1|nr:hypothetical protein AXH09_10765 [Pseudomonas aeruginosa]